MGYGEYFGGESCIDPATQGRQARKNVREMKAKAVRCVASCVAGAVPAHHPPSQNTDHTWELLGNRPPQFKGDLDWTKSYASEAE